MACASVGGLGNGGVGDGLHVVVSPAQGAKRRVPAAVLLKSAFAGALIAIPSKLLVEN